MYRVHRGELPVQSPPAEAIARVPEAANPTVLLPHPVHAAHPWAAAASAAVHVAVASAEAEALVAAAVVAVAAAV